MLVYQSPAANITTHIPIPCVDDDPHQSCRATLGEGAESIGCLPLISNIKIELAASLSRDQLLPAKQDSPRLPS
jgi:hypothetical protein